MTVEIRPTLSRAQFRLCPFFYFKEQIMNIQNIKIENLKKYDNNPRKIAKQAINSGDDRK